MEKERLERARQFAETLCRYAGKDRAFYENFWTALVGEEDILEEFCYFPEHQQFACSASVEGYTVVDVMVWQIDHFKAEMDRKDPGMGQNGDKMVLMAFDTFLKMRKNPGKYIRALQGETGTDYPEKY